MRTAVSTTGAAARQPRQYANGVARREEILDAANALVVEVGSRGFSLRELAARAGLSHPGLLRHFASTDDVLLALLDRHERASSARLAHAGLAGAGTAGAGTADVGVAGAGLAGAGTGTFARLAEHNQTVPGYIALFTTLAGEATSPAHPAHARFASRYERLRALVATQLERARDAGTMAADIAPLDEAVRLAAAWDGLQLQSLYEPHVDVVAGLRAHLAPRPLSPSTALSASTARPPSTGKVGSNRRDEPTFPVRGDRSGGSGGRGEVSARGYASGRARRDEIVDQATTLFAASGFHGTSLQGIADGVGISKTTLLHHFASKDDLLIAVLRRRDERAVSWALASGISPIDAVSDIPAGARRNAEQPGLVELYSVLACESASPGHPGHAFFGERFRVGRSYFTSVFAALAADGRLRPGADPAFEATWLLALWDGLQFQWLYDPAAVDVAGQLEGHLSQVIVG